MGHLDEAEAIRKQIEKYMQSNSSTSKIRRFFDMHRLLTYWSIVGESQKLKQLLEAEKTISNDHVSLYLMKYDKIYTSIVALHHRQYNQVIQLLESILLPADKRLTMDDSVDVASPLIESYNFTKQWKKSLDILKYLEANFNQNHSIVEIYRLKAQRLLCKFSFKKKWKKGEHNKQQSIKKATKLFTEAIQIAQDNSYAILLPKIAIDFANLYIALNETDEAIKLLQKSISPFQHQFTKIGYVRTANQLLQNLINVQKQQQLFPQPTTSKQNTQYSITQSSTHNGDFNDEIDENSSFIYASNPTFSYYYQLAVNALNENNELKKNEISQRIDKMNVIKSQQLRTDHNHHDEENTTSKIEHLDQKILLKNEKKSSKIYKKQANLNESKEDNENDVDENNEIESDIKKIPATPSIKKKQKPIKDDELKSSQSLEIPSTKKKKKTEDTEAKKQTKNKKTAFN